jgi:surface protein
MGQIAAVVQRLGSSSDIVVTRIKDRFLTSPSGGGWRDCMLNFYLKEDSNQHVCEVQLVHQQMMTARKGLPGHAVYSRVRNADEIVNQWMGREKPQTKVEMQEWLVGWQQGDKGTRGPPNLWDIRKVTDMSELFNRQELKEFNDPIGDWDMRNVVNMEGMFRFAKSFNQPIGQWQTENVSNMARMFYEASSFNQPIGQWQTENAAKDGMFLDAKAMEEKNKPGYLQQINDLVEVGIQIYVEAAARLEGLMSEELLQAIRNNINSFIVQFSGVERVQRSDWGLGHAQCG